MYKKDDIIEVEIIDIGNEGEGIGKIDAFPFFIKGALPGDIVEAKVMKAKKNYAYARLMRVIKPSVNRVEPRCAVAGPCGGCQLQGMKYEEQLRFKEKKVFNNLVRIGGVDSEYLKGIFEPIMGMENPWRYRNKAQYPIARNKNGDIIAGFYAGHTHSVIETKDCHIGPEHHRDILKTITDFMEIEGIEPYNEAAGSGIVRHVLIRDAFAAGQCMVALVLNCDLSASKRWMRLCDRLVKCCDRISSIYLNENKEQTNTILGRKCLLLYGSETIEDELCGLRFRISPLSFYQVNPLQTQKLYSTAIEFADIKEGEELWDICCGIGTITLAAAAATVGKVHGIEIVPSAIENAKENARLNNIDNVEFICAAAEEYLPAHRNEISADVIITDPPRKGMDERALEVMVSMQPSRIVYVSCDSATLARDIKYLCENGYELKRVRPCDMFGHSVHVETVVLMSKVNTVKI